MIIRINLLAESRAAEKSRRHDPVKRSIFIGVFLVVFALVWSSSVQLELFIAQSNLSQTRSQIDYHSNLFQAVTSKQKQIAGIKVKLDALQKLNQARFLHGNYLNALQLTTLEGVQLMRIRFNQTYVNTPAVPSQTKSGKVIPGSPATSLESKVLGIEAKDFSANPGDAVNRFKELIAGQPYFKTMLNPTNAIKLTGLSAPQSGPDGHPYVLFNLECYFPDTLQ
jgi:hypothetical protein